MIEQIEALITIFPHAVLGGLVIAAGCAFIGFFVVVKRVVFIGIAISQIAVCGIAAGMVWGFSPMLGAAGLTIVASVFLSQPYETRKIPRDAVLGILFVLAAATSILLVSKSGFGRHEIETLLYGDLILAAPADMVVIVSIIVPAILLVGVFFRPILYTLYDRDTARLMGINVRLWEVLFYVVLGLIVSVASKTAGSLLVFCFLVVAPSAGLILGRTLVSVFLTSITVAVFSTAAGLFISFSRDYPANQMIAVIACGMFVFVCLICRISIPALRR